MSGFTSNSVRLLVLFTGVWMAGGCRPAGVESYVIPKEEAAQDLPQAAPAPAPALSWQKPEGWADQPPGQFRVASFKVAGPEDQQADVSVIPLPGKAGGDASNVNRWREQAGLPALNAEDLAATGETVEIDGQPATLYDLAGSEVSILGVIHHREGTAWFIKMTGAPALVAGQKPSFVAFLRSFRFAASQSAREAAAGDAHPSGAHWHPPAHWKSLPPGQFLAAKYEVSGATVNVSSSAGDGGGLAANVNRWRRQLGLAELSAEEITRAASTSASGAAVIEIAGDNAVVVGAIVRRPDQTWFYKLMGDHAAVAANKKAFLDFVDGAHY